MKNRRETGTNGRVNVLVAGMGTPAYGKERRAARMFTAMERITPYFLISKWEDGSVSRLLDQNQMHYTHTPFGYLGRARPSWTLISILHMPTLFRDVLFAQHRRQGKIVVSLDLMSVLNALPAMLALKGLCGTRFVFYLGDIPAPNRANRWLARIAGAFSDCFIANSKAVKQGLVRAGVGEDRIHVVHNGICVEAYKQSEPLPLRDHFGWSTCSLLIGYVGQFHPKKGLDDLLAALRVVREQYEVCKVVIVGKAAPEDENYRRILRQIESYSLHTDVAFTGWLDDVAAAYKALDVVVVPSRYEDPAPNVNIEAMASGVPVIATRAGGSPELVVDGETGFLVDKESPEQIAERILQLAGDPGLRERMGRAGRERVARHFDVRKNARRVEEVILNG